MKNVLDVLNVNSKVLLVDKEYTENIVLSARNIPGVKFVSAEGINVLDVLNHGKLILTKEAVAKIEEVLV